MISFRSLLFLVHLIIKRIFPQFLLNFILCSACVCVVKTHIMAFCSSLMLLLLFLPFRFETLCHTHAHAHSASFVFLTNKIMANNVGNNAMRIFAILCFDGMLFRFPILSHCRRHRRFLLRSLCFALATKQQWQSEDPGVCYISEWLALSHGYKINIEFGMVYLWCDAMRIVREQKRKRECQ